MTLSRGELERERAVTAEALDWRRWRRSMCLTIAEAAAMAGMSTDWLQRVELGRPMGPKTRAKLQVLMARWSEELRPHKVERRGAHLAEYNRARARARA